MKRVTLICIILFVSSIYCENYPGISPEFSISVPVFGTASGDQRNPAIAFDGENYLVVWEDMRDEIYGETSYHIYCARVNGKGEVIDKAGIRLSDYAESANPAVAFDGENYLVVWSSWDSYINGRRISKNGEVLDEYEIDISEKQANWEAKVDPAVVFDGTDYLVVWNNKDMISAVKVRKTGEPFTNVFTIRAVPQSDQIQKPVVAFDGENYFAVWIEKTSSGNVLNGTRIGKNRQVFNDNINISKYVVRNYSGPDILFDGSVYFVVWEDVRNSNIDIYGTRISTSGKVLDSNDIAISSAPDVQSSPEIVFNGTDYFVIWSDYRNTSSHDIYGARVAGDGAVIDKEGIPISDKITEQNTPVISFDGKNYLAAWESGSDIYGIRISRDGDLIPTSPSQNILSGISEIPISSGMYGQFSPDIVFDGKNYFAVWIESRDGDNAVYGSRITNNGLLLDGDGILVGESAILGKKPSVAFDGTNYLVVWAGYPDQSTGILEKYESTLKGARVSKEGELLDKTAFNIAPLTIGFDDQSPEVVFNGSSFMVVWITNVCGCTVYPHGNYVYYCDPLIKGANVLKDGKVQLTSEFEIEDAYVSGIACGKSNCLIVWKKGSGITAALFSKDFTRISSDEIKIAGSIQLYPSSVIYDGTDYIIVWSDTSWENDYDLGISRITQEGEVKDIVLTISTATNNIPESREIVFDGKNYFAVWQGRNERGDYSLDIFGSFMSEEGIMLREDDVIISSDEQLEISPAVASSGDGKSLIVYQHFDNRKNYNAYRIAARFADPDLNAFSDWDNAEPDEENEIPEIDEDKDVDTIDDQDVYMTDSEDNEREPDDAIEIDEDLGMDNDSVISEKQSNGCSCAVVY